MSEIDRYLTRDEAEALTAEIQESLENTHVLILRAHEGRAWRALGYATWEAYVRDRFDMARRTSYQVLDQARVIRAIEDATDDVRHGAQIHVTEREARDIKPIVGQVADAIRSRVAADPDRTAAIVAEEVERARRAAQERAQADRNLRDLESRIDADRFNEQYRDPLGVDTTAAIIRAVNTLAGLGVDPAQAADLFADYRRHNIDNTIDTAADWLANFRNAWRTR